MGIVEIISEFGEQQSVGFNTFSDTTNSFNTLADRQHLYLDTTQSALCTLVMMSLLFQPFCIYASKLNDPVDTCKNFDYRKEFCTKLYFVQQIMHFWVILVKKTHRFLCSVRFQLQYPCIFLPIYLFPVKIRTKNQTNKTFLLFYSSWFLKWNLQNEIMYKLMYHFYSASLKNTSILLV